MEMFGLISSPRMAWLEGALTSSPTRGVSGLVRRMVGRIFLDYGQLTDFLVDPCGQCIVSYVQIKVHLKAKPETGGVAEILRQPQSRIGCNSPFAVDDLVDSARGNPKVFAKPILTYGQRLEELLFQNLARMYGRNLLHVSPLVIIYDFNVMRTAMAPDEADSPLLIDSYAMLPFSASRKSFQAVARRNTQVFNARTPIQHAQFPKRGLLNIGRQPS